MAIGGSVNAIRDRVEPAASPGTRYAAEAEVSYPTAAQQDERDDRDYQD